MDLQPSDFKPGDRVEFVPWNYGYREGLRLGTVTCIESYASHFRRMAPVVKQPAEDLLANMLKSAEGHDIRDFPAVQRILRHGAEFALCVSVRPDPMPGMPTAPFELAMDPTGIAKVKVDDNRN